MLPNCADLPSPGTRDSQNCVRIGIPRSNRYNSREYHCFIIEL